MLLNISSDQIGAFVQWTTHILPYQDIERNVWPWLIELIDQYSVQKLFVLNGPWSFTTLRVCCLAINLIKQHTSLTIFSTNKPTLFHRLGTTTDFPKHIALTIWQKKNCRLYDCITKKEQKISFLERQDMDNVLIDPLIDNVLIWWETYAHRQLHFQRNDQQQLMIATLQKSWLIDLTASYREEKDLLHPDYLIDPTMG